MNHNLFSPGEISGNYRLFFSPEVKLIGSIYRMANHSHSGLCKYSARGKHIITKPVSYTHLTLPTSDLV